MIIILFKIYLGSHLNLELLQKLLELKKDCIKQSLKKQEIKLLGNREDQKHPYEFLISNSSMHFVNYIDQTLAKLT